MKWNEKRCDKFYKCLEDNTTHEIKVGNISAAYHTILTVAIGAMVLEEFSKQMKGKK